MTRQKICTRQQGWQAVIAVHRTHMLGGDCLLDAHGCNKERTFTRASDDFGHAIGAVEFCFCNADHRNFLIQRLVQMCSQTWPGLATEPDIAVDNCTINCPQCLEDSEEARQFAAIKLAWLIRLNVLDADYILVERLCIRPVAKRDSGSARGVIAITYVEADKHRAVNYFTGSSRKGSCGWIVRIANWLVEEGEMSDAVSTGFGTKTMQVYGEAW